MKDDLVPFYKERTFYLDTTPEQFAGWLQAHVTGGLVTPPGAEIHVGLTQFTPPSNFGLTTRLEIHGYVESPDPEEKGAALCSRLPGVIRFKVISLARERIEVKAECHDPALMAHFDQLLARIERAFGQPPEEQRATPTPTRSDTPRVPSRPADYRRWRATWYKSKPQVERGDSTRMICKWLERMHPNLACSAETLDDVIRAGEAGLLDKPNLPEIA